MRVAAPCLLAGLLAGAVSADSLSASIPGSDPQSVKILSNVPVDYFIPVEDFADALLASSAKASSKTTARTTAKTTAKTSSTTSKKTSTKASATSSVKTSAKTSAKPPTTSAKTSSKTTAKTSSTSVKTSSHTTVKTSSSASAKISPTISAKASTSSSAKTPTTAQASSKTSARTSTSPTPTYYGNATSAHYIVAPVPKWDELANYANNYTGAYAESAHFRIWGQNNTNTTMGLRHLEGTWTCFVDHLGWRSSGLSAFDYGNNGPYYKTSYFIYNDLPGADAITTEDMDTGLGFVFVLPEWVNYEGVVSHEYGHVMSVAEPQFWNQTNNRGWFETVAQYVSETYNNSPFCESARDAVNDTQTGGTLFSAQMLHSYSWWSLIDATNSQYSIGNQYQAWPFLSYLTYNLDNYTTFGTNAMLDIFKNYSVNSNETLFHTMNRMAAREGKTIQSIVGRYWARMAWADYGSPVAQNYFDYLRPSLDYNNTLPVGNNSYEVIPARAPRYMGASLVVLANTTATVSATVSAPGNFTAYFSVQAVADGPTRYVELLPVAGTAGLKRAAVLDTAAGDNVVLVVANTPTQLLMYDAQHLDWSTANDGLQFTFTLEGAVPVPTAPVDPRFE